MANTRPSAKYPYESVRNHHFDNLKAVLIFLVVFGHLIEPYRQTGSIITFLYYICYILHMPIFVFVSGYFFNEKIKQQLAKIPRFLLLLFFLLLAR